MKKLLSRKNENGATIIEYVLIAALLSIAAIVALGVIGTQIGVTFSAVGDSLSNANANI